MSIEMFFRILFTPSCWFRSQPTSMPVSYFINAALDDGHAPTDIGPYTCTLKGKRIWITNFPYSYGGICVGGDVMNRTNLPDRATVFRLYDVVELEKARNS